MKKKGYATALVMLMSLGAPLVAHAAEDPNLQAVNSSQGVESVDKGSSSTQTQTANSSTLQDASQTQSTYPVTSQDQQTGDGSTQQNQNTNGSTMQTQNINGSGTGSESQTQGTTSSTHLGQTTNQACTDNPGQNETIAVNTNQTQSVSTTSSAQTNQTQTSTLGTSQTQTTHPNGGTVQQNQATTVGATQSQNVTTQTGTVHQNQNESLGLTQSQHANTTGSSTVQQNQTTTAQTSQSQASTGYLGKPEESQTGSVDSSETQIIQTSSSASLQQIQTAQLNATGSGYGSTLHTTANNTTTVSITQQENGYQVDISGLITTNQGQTRSYYRNYVVYGSHTAQFLRNYNFGFAWGSVAAQIKFSAANLSEILQAKIESLFTINYSSPGIQQGPTQDDQIVAVIRKNVLSMNDKDIDGYMSTMSSRLNNDEYKESVIKEFAASNTMFNINAVKITEFSPTGVKVDVTLLQQSGGANSLIEKEYDLVIENGQYKIDNTQILTDTPAQ